MKILVLAKNYIKYIFKAKNEHSLQSPFLYNFYFNAVVQKKSHANFKLIETIRKKLIASKNEVDFIDYGAGSHLIKTEKRKISEITRICSKSKKEGELLYNIVNYFKPKTILELGTSVGISTMYMASGNQNSKFITLEGVEQVADQASKNFATADIKNIEVIVGEFSTNLSKAIDQLGVLEFVYIDGNHKKKPTIDYFKNCLPYITNDSVFIFDDIHWSNGMEEAWEEICNHPQTTVCLDLFFIGIVFFKKELSKERFVLKYSA